MNKNGDGNTEEEKKKVEIKSELLQKKQCLPGMEPEASIN
jgi:hypothetical protein